MRDYKFRAWDTQANKMYSSEDLEQPDAPTDAQKTIYGYLSFGVLCIYDFRSPEPVEFIPMQYIGFLDKNMNEIYEGDFIKIEDKNYEVIWSKEIAGFVLITNSGDSMVAGEYLMDSSEIIGNIYTNPDWVVNSSLR